MDASAVLHLVALAEVFSVLLVLVMTDIALSGCRVAALILLGGRIFDRRMVPGVVAAFSIHKRPLTTRVLHHKMRMAFGRKLAGEVGTGRRGLAVVAVDLLVRKFRGPSDVGRGNLFAFVAVMLPLGSLTLHFVAVLFCNGSAVELGWCSLLRRRVRLVFLAQARSLTLGIRMHVAAVVHPDVLAVVISAAGHLFEVAHRGLVVI